MSSLVHSVLERVVGVIRSSGQQEGEAAAAMPRGKPKREEESEEEEQPDDSFEIDLDQDSEEEQSTAGGTVEGSGSDEGSGSEEEGGSSSSEEEEEGEEEASSPPAPRRGRRAEPVGKPARRRGRTQRLVAAEEEEEEEEEEAPAPPAAAKGKRQPERRAAAQQRQAQAADGSASEASRRSSRRTASRQPAADKPAAAPSRLGRGASRQQPAAEEGQQQSVLEQLVAAGELVSCAMLNNMRVAELQAKCERLALPADGRKPDLVDRLLRWFEQQERQQEEAGGGGSEGAAAEEQPAAKQRRQPAAKAAAGKRKEAEAAAAAEPEDNAPQEAEQQAGKRARRGAAAAPTAQQQPEQQAVAAAADEEEEEDMQRGRKRRGSGRASGRLRAAAEAAAVEQSPAPGAQRATRSPTPAAAAPQLEMSLPPDAAAWAAAASEHQHWDEEMADAAAEEQEAAGAAAGPAAAAAAFLRRRLTQPRSAEAGTMELRPRLQEAYRSLLDSLAATVDLGHNNSLLLVGPRGCGKTLVAERALADLAARCNTNPKDPVVGVIRLSGQAHAEERTAFREVARQLCEVFGYQFAKGASIGENIEFLRGMLGRLQSCDKCALFLLDDFDAFATKRAKQTLLYNLLDALQTSGMQAAVVGLTCRQDVVETLEKRVKSRFSHRKVDLSLPTSALPVAAQAGDEHGQGQREAQDGALGVLQAMLTLPPQFADQAYASKWNASVAAAAGSPEVKQALQRCVNVYPSLRHLANIADWALCAAGGSGELSAATLAGVIERQLSQAKGMVSMVAGLPILDLILLVALQRLAQRGKEDVNFEMAHHEFSKYLLLGSHVDTYSRGAAAKAYDHLLSQGLVAFVDPRSEARVGARQYSPAYLLLTREEVEEGLVAHPNCPQSLSEWLKKEGGLGTTAGHFLS